jgi:hypothetical protein
MLNSISKLKNYTEVWIVSIQDEIAYFLDQKWKHIIKMINAIAMVKYTLYRNSINYFFCLNNLESVKMP